MGIDIATEVHADTTRRNLDNMPIYIGSPSAIGPLGPRFYVTYPGGRGDILSTVTIAELYPLEDDYDHAA